MRAELLLRNEPPYSDCVPAPVSQSSRSELRISLGAAIRSVAFSSFPSSGIPRSTMVLIYDFIPSLLSAPVSVYHAGLAQTFLRRSRARSIAYSHRRGISISITIVDFIVIISDTPYIC